MAYAPRTGGVGSSTAVEGGVARDRGQSTGFPLTHMRHLGRRVVIYAWSGYFVAGALIIGALVGRYLAGIEDLDAVALILLGIVVALYRSAAWLMARRYVAPDRSAEVRGHLLRIMYAMIGLDYLILTIALWFVGGTRCPFLPFYLVHVILSCLLLSRRAALTFHWLAYGLLATFVIAEWAGLLVPRMPTGAVAASGPLDGRYALTVLVVYFLLFSLTLFLLLGVVRTARNGERRLRAANAELDRVSTMRKDFLRIALHNLQSPVGVVTMFLGNLKADLGGSMSEQQAKWIERSLVRLQGIKDFMHDLQMLSTLESGRVEAQATSIDVAALLRDLVEEHADLARQGGNTLALDLPTDLPAVFGIRLLLREAVSNYITNAVKYTPSGGAIVVRAMHRPPFVRVEVEDEGIGIVAEDRDRLFSEFYRIQRKDDTAKKVQGTGLGLNIVRAVIEAHGGEVGMHSRVDEGSVFYADIPIASTPSMPVS